MAGDPVGPRSSTDTPGNTPPVSSRTIPDTWEVWTERPEADSHTGVTAQIRRTKERRMIDAMRNIRTPADLGLRHVEVALSGPATRVHRVAAGCFTAVMPHGPRPTGIFFVTCFVATSITATSFDGPLAV